MDRFAGGATMIMRRLGSPIRPMATLPLDQPPVIGVYSPVPLFMLHRVLYPMGSPMPMWWNHQLGIAAHTLVSASPLPRGAFRKLFRLSQSPK